MQDWLTIGHDPIHFDYEFTSVFAAGGFDDSPVRNHPHLLLLFRRESDGVVPEVDSVNAAIVEPQTNVMRMIYAFARTWLKWKSSGDDRSRGSAQRI